MVEASELIDIELDAVSGGFFYFGPEAARPERGYDVSPHKSERAAPPPDGGYHQIEGRLSLLARWYR